MLNDKPAGAEGAPPAIDFAGLLSRFDELESGDQDDGETPDPDEQGEGETSEKPEGDAETPEAESADEGETEDQSTETEDDEETEIEDAGGEPDPDAALRARKHKVRSNGQDLEVTYDELLAGYSRTDDYTRKSQVNAEAKRKLDEETGAVRARRTQLDESLKQVEDALTVMLPKEPDWDRVRAEQPDLYPALFTDWQRFQAQLSEVKGARKRIADEAAAEQATANAETTKAEFQKLVAAVPEWKDRKRLAADLAKIADTGRAYGFTQDELNSIADHRVALLLRDAMQFRDIRAQQKAARDKLNKTGEGALRGTKPGPGRRKPSPDVERAAGRLAKSGRVEDFASAIGPILEAEERATRRR